MTKTVNTEHIKRDIVIIGTSSGGVEALMSLFKNLTSPLLGAVAVASIDTP